MKLGKCCGQKHIGELSGLLVCVWFTRWIFMPTPERQSGGGIKRVCLGIFFFFLIRPKATCRDQGKHVGFHVLSPEVGPYS